MAAPRYAIGHGYIYLTPQGSHIVSERAEESAGAPETEITPAMIDAGVEILIDIYDAIGGEVDRAMAAKIFTKMMERASSAGPRSADKVS